MSWISDVVLREVTELVVDVHGERFRRTMALDHAGQSYMLDMTKSNLRALSSQVYYSTLEAFNGAGLAPWLGVSDADAMGSIAAMRAMATDNMARMVNSITARTIGVEFVSTRVIAIVRSKVALAFLVQFALEDLFAHANGDYLRSVDAGLMTDSQAYDALQSSLRQALSFTAALERGWLDSIVQTDTEGASGLGAGMTPGVVALIIAGIVAIAALIYFVDSDRVRQTMRYNICREAINNKTPGYETCLAPGTVFGGGSSENPIKEGATAAGTWLGLGLFAAFVGAIAMPGIIASIERARTAEVERESMRRASPRSAQRHDNRPAPAHALVPIKA